MEEFSRRRSNRITDPFDVVDYTLTAEASAATTANIIINNSRSSSSEDGDVMSATAMR